MGALGSDDWIIAALAAPQYGVVARRQLVTAGLTRRRIGRRVASGRLHVVHRGVYAVGHQSMSEEARWLAAVLACGDGAVLSHRSAGALWLLCRDGERPAVTARNGLRAPGVETHRALLDPADVTVHRGIPVTTVARTLADLGHLLDEAPYDRAVREAMFTRRFDEAGVRDALTRRPCRRLTEHLHDAAPTQSALEDLFLAICDRHGIPRPATQQGVSPRVDFVWPHARVVVEVDGWQAHGTRHAFQRDRATTNALQLAGFVVLRFTHEDLVRRPARVAAQVRAALGL